MTPKFSLHRLVALLCFVLPLSVPARQAGAAVAADQAIARLKRIQLLQMKREVPERIAEARARLELLERRDVEQARQELSPRRDDDPRDARHRPTTAEGVAPRRTAAAPANIRINNLAGDDPDASQNEPSVAAWGSDVLVAWNDWPRLDFSGSLQGYAYSTDGGITFTDAGEVPAPVGTYWLSDPVMTVNEKTGEFYYCGLFEDPNPDLGVIYNGVAVMRGVFSGSTLLWDTPRIVRETTNQTDVIDKPWIAADSLSGNLYLAYTLFLGGCATCPDSIVFQRSQDKAGSWSGWLSVSAPAAAGSVHGARPAVGPTGEVYVTWFEQGLSQLPGYDFFRIRKSTDQGASFGPEHTVATFFSNFGTGAPGYNRDHGVSFPSIGVDRSDGANRGRVYVSWNESLDWYDDVASAAFGGAGIRNEVEPNDQLRLGASPFVPGETLVGSFRDSAGVGTLDVDFWSFPAVQGQTYAFWCDSVPRSLYTMRIVCADSLQRLAFASHQDPPLDAHNESVIVWTCPTTGTYFLRMFYLDDLPSHVGPYHIRTGPVSGVGDRGRDQRDVFVAGSDDGITFDPPVRVNDDPPYYDNWLPEVSVSGDGSAFSMWYDWREGPPEVCGGISNIRMSRSDDGGLSWSPLGRMTTQSTVWTFVESNLVPNQGDYLGLYVNDQAVYFAWTDGRLVTVPDTTGGSSDIWGATFPLLSDSLQVRVSGTATPEQVTLNWSFKVARVVPVDVYRLQGSGAEALLATTFTGADGMLHYVDDTVDRGIRYTYRLVVDESGASHSVGRFSIVVPVPAVLLHLPQPNPLRDRTYFKYEIPGAGGQVVIEVFDVTGRRVRTLINAQQSAGLHDAAWNALDDHDRRVRSGIYFIRLSFADTRQWKRVSVVP